MKSLVEMNRLEASAVVGGKDPEVAQLVEFIAECIGSFAKMIYMANRFRKLLLSPAKM